MNTVWIVCPVYFDVEPFTAVRRQLSNYRGTPGLMVRVSNCSKEFLTGYYLGAAANRFV